MVKETWRREIGMINDNVIDLVEYKLNRWLHDQPPGTHEWDIAERVVLLYLEGLVNVTWAKDDILISMKDGSDPPHDLFGSDSDPVDDSE